MKWKIQQIPEKSWTVKISLLGLLFLVVLGMGYCFSLRALWRQQNLLNSNTRKAEQVLNNLTHSLNQKNQDNLKQEILNIPSMNQMQIALSEQAIACGLSVEGTHELEFLLLGNYSDWLCYLGEIKKSQEKIMFEKLVIEKIGKSELNNLKITVVWAQPTLLPQSDSE